VISGGRDWMLPGDQRSLAAVAASAHRPPAGRGLKSTESHLTL